MEKGREKSQIVFNKPFNACPRCWETKKGIYVPVPVFLDEKMFGYRYQCPLCGYVVPDTLSRPKNGNINDFNVERWPEVRKNNWDAQLLRDKFNQERWVQSVDLKPTSSLEEDLANAIL